MADSALTRRQVLKTAGLLGAGTLVGWEVINSLSDVMAAPAPMPMTAQAGDVAARQWFFLMDLRKCDGCEACTKACREQHFLPEETSWIKIYKLTEPNGHEYFMPRVCMQCENAPCVKVCPVGASYKSPDGITLIDQTKCIGCRMCMAACPYEARYFNFNDPPAVPEGTPPARPEWPVPQVRGTVGKCVMCVHNLRDGKLPKCVESCSMQALYVGDLNSDLMTNGAETFKFSEYMKENHVVRFKEELNTRPRVYYVMGHGEHLEH